MKFDFVFEQKDVKKFTVALKDMLKSDQKAKSLFQDFKKDKDKIVDYIDYVMSKYTHKLDKMMKEYNVDYEEAIDLLTRGI